jgi:hypothetical protein
MTTQRHDHDNTTSWSWTIELQCFPRFGDIDKLSRNNCFHREGRIESLQKNDFTTNIPFYIDTISHNKKMFLENLLG